MTERRFYTWVAFLPFVLPLVAAAIALPSANSEAGSPTGITKLASLVYLTGVFAIVPYAVVLAGVYWRVRSAPRVSFRRLAWSLPLWICIVFAPIFALASGRGDGARGFAVAVLVGGLWAFVVACGYAALIEVIRFVGWRVGWIREPTLPAVSDNG